MPELHNYMEDIAKNILGEVLKDVPKACSCPKCCMDILALALNGLPSRYVVTDKGRVYAKITALELQFRTDVTRELTKALERVKRNPQHTC